MSYERSDVDPLGGAVSVRAVRCVCVCVCGWHWHCLWHTAGALLVPGGPHTFRPRGGAGGWLGPRGGALVRFQPGRGSCRRRRGCIGHRIVEPQPGAPPPRPDAASSR